ncbi:MAG: NAD(P)/FAD-dependent oxidoreductase [Clostridia bacterium]
MEKFDVVIIGAATSGSFFARRMAELGFSVKILESMSNENLGKRLDIIHIASNDFDKFSLPRPKKGDDDWGFEFDGGYTISPFNNYPKYAGGVTVGVHMHEYIVHLNRWAEEKGAQFEYGATFTDFVFNENKIVGVHYVVDGKSKMVSARVVVDCSGATAALRCKLPDGYGIENNPLTANDMFYVILHYVKYSDEKNYVTQTRGWPYYKTWEAPEADPTSAILGVGANFSYDYAEEVYKDFVKNIPLPEHEVTRIERGVTPYTRPPYSFVADGIIVMGDAGCLTKPMNGEGVTSSMVQMEIAVDVLKDALNNDEYVSQKKLWRINNEYNLVQGADFASMRAILIKAVGAKKDEFEYFFKKNIIFSEKFLEAAGQGKEIKISVGNYLHIGCGILLGLLSGKISRATIKSLKKGLSNGGKLKELYLNFPQTPLGYANWKIKADKLWAEVGSMSDNK